MTSEVKELVERLNLYVESDPLDSQSLCLMLSEAADTLQSQERRIGALEEALKPFARWCEAARIEAYPGDHIVIGRAHHDPAELQILASDFIAARTTLTTGGGHDGQP